MFGPAGLRARHHAGAARGVDAPGRLGRGGRARRSSTTARSAPGSPDRPRSWWPTSSHSRATYPGLEHVHLSNSMGTPQNVMLEQLAWLGKEVMPSFVAR